MAIEGLTLKWGIRIGGGEGMEEGNRKNDEKKEFPKGEFSGFGCVLECSETQCLFSLS